MPNAHPQPDMQQKRRRSCIISAPLSGGRAMYADRVAAHTLLVGQSVAHPTTLSPAPGGALA